MDPERIEELRKKGFSYREIFSRQRIDMEERIHELEEFRRKLEGEIRRIGGMIIRNCKWVVNGVLQLLGSKIKGGKRCVKPIPSAVFSARVIQCCSAGTAEGGSRTSRL